MSDPEVGLYFELYGVDAVASWYRLRAEVEDRDTGATRALRIRPVGEGDFHSRWERRPSTGSPTVEFVTASLRDVPPGDYTLRVVAELGEGASELVLERAISRR